MLRKTYIVFAFILMALGELAAQDSPVRAIKGKFDNFEYQNVILMTDSVLAKGDSLSMDERSELLRMKAVSQYSLSDTKGAGESFREILEISPGFALDSLNNSPKIISFFNDIKSSFIPKVKETGKNKITDNPEVKTDKSEVKSDKVPEVKTPEVKRQASASLYLSEYNDRLKNSLLRSIILPGWGQFYSGNSAKGLILGSAGIAALSSFIYFITDSRQKEKDYLNERDLLLISDKYDTYNASNRMKYISLSAYALVWLYSQVDILFFSDGLFRTEISLQPEQISKSTTGTQFTVSFNLPL